MKHKAGMCPKCGCSVLNYTEMEIVGNTLFQQYSCNKCSFEGKEEHGLRFKKHTDLNGIKIINVKISESINL